MPIEFVLLLAGCAVVVVAPWVTVKMLWARRQRKAAERTWAQAGVNADLALDARIDMLGPLSEDELKELLRVVVWEISRSGSVTWPELQSQVGWVRAKVRANGAGAGPDLLK